MLNPLIKQIPNRATVLKMVDRLVDTQADDSEAYALIEIISATANFENPEQSELAQAIIHSAYAKTMHCQQTVENGIRDFLGNKFLIRPTADGSDDLNVIG